MRILVFNYEYPPIGGGGGWINSMVAEELAARHQVTVITSAYGDLPREETRNGVDIVRVRVQGRRRSQVASLRSLLTYPISAYAAGMRLTRRVRFDVINSHFAVPTGPGSVPVARRRSLPHVLSLHGGDLYDPSKSLSPHRFAPTRWTVSAVLNASTAVVAQSTNTRDNVYRFYDYEGPVEIIPLGIRAPEFKQVDRTKLGLPQDAFLAISISRLIKRKGLDGLLRALSRKECDGVHLVVVGAGPELEPLKELSSRAGIAERIHFAGYVEDQRKWELLQCADAYVSSTLHEGFGLVYIEAMMVGLPVVSYDHGGQTDFLREGETGRLVRAGDEAGLATAIGELVQRPELARTIGEHNRSASAAFTVDRCAKAYEQLFERVVSEDSNGTGRATRDRSNPDSRLSH